MNAFELIDRWPSGHAVAGVVGAGRGVLATRGDTRERRPWASVTKLLAAMTTLVAVEEGTVSLEDPVGPPGATIRHLLAHASGLAFVEDRVHASPGRRRIYSSRAAPASRSVSRLGHHVRLTRAPTPVVSRSAQSAGG